MPAWKDLESEVWPSGDEGNRHGVEVGIAVADGPPEFGIGEVEGRVRRGSELDGFGFGCGEGDRQLSLDVAEVDAQRAGDGLHFLIVERGLDGDVGVGGVGERKRGGDERRLEGDGAGSGEGDVVPDAVVAAADGGDPVPAGGGVEGGVVAAERAAVDGAAGLIFRAAGVGIGDDADSEGVGCAGMDEGGGVEAAAHHAAVDAPEVLAIEIDFGLPVDAVEVEPEVVAGCERGPDEFVAIPEVAAEEGIGDGVLVVAEVGVGDGVVVEVAGEGGAGNGGDHPVGIGEAGLSDLFAGGRDERGALEFPCAAGELEGTVRGGLGGEVRSGDGTAAAKDFEFVEDVGRAGVSGFGHEDADVATILGLSEVHVVSVA